MNNIGKLTTFKRLLEEESVIMIPKVQRDYAYGRKEPKAADILDGMLDTILTAIAKNTQETLDFVYGGSFVKGNNEDSGLIPLDGQQRLTTLFLLYYFASIFQKDVTQKEVQTLLKFRYETRQSATSFIKSLVGDIRNDIIKVYNDETNIRDLVRDNPKYLPSYDADPTIESMLNVLEKIEDKCRNSFQIDELWTKLNKQDNIRFYALSLDKFGLTDDLYIKMNSRGKKLTQFEIFKSDLEKAINKISPKLKDEISIKIDNSWMDILWGFANLDGESVDVVKKSDDGFMHLFNNLFRLELFRREIETKKNRLARIDEIITSEEAVTDIISLFDVMSDIQKKEGIQEYWNSFFYFSDEVVGNQEQIRLFWQQKQNQKPVFYLAMERDLSVPEMCYLYALYLVNTQKKSYEEAFRCLRVVRNLVTANVRANSARYDMLAGFLNDVDEIVANNGILTDNPHTFVSTACEEEKYKINTFSDTQYHALLQYENHFILQGSVMLFVEKYYHDSGEVVSLMDNLSHFESVFNNDSPGCFDLIRISLLDSATEYMQYDPSMEKETDLTRRFFIHNESDFLQFFIQNERRRNQKAILDILRDNISSLADLKSPKEKCQEFGIETWQYYMAKYMGANRKDTKYGCYAWNDKANRPLEIVILNSSYHSIYNIEWKMLNHILYSELNDEEKYSLDSHASSAFSMDKCGVTLTILQEGWKVGCNNEVIIHALENSDLYTISPVEGEDTMYIFDFRDIACGMDYVELGIHIVQDLEKWYDNNHTAS